MMKKLLTIMFLASILWGCEVNVKVDPEKFDSTTNAWGDTLQKRGDSIDAAVDRMKDKIDHDDDDTSGLH